jgi:hypothetical protein
MGSGRTPASFFCELSAPVCLSASLPLSTPYHIIFILLGAAARHLASSENTWKSLLFHGVWCAATRMTVSY